MHKTFKIVSALLLTLLSFVAVAQIGPQPPAVYGLTWVSSQGGAYAHFELNGVAPKGMNDLLNQFIVVGRPDVWTNNCVVLVQFHTVIYLLDDNYTQWLGGFPVGSNNTVENSRCKLEVFNTSEVYQGTTGALLKANLAFKPLYNGVRTVYGLLQDMNYQSGTNLDGTTGWFHSQNGDITVNAPSGPNVPGEYQLVEREITDTSSGLLWANNKPFATSGYAGNWSFYAGSRGSSGMIGHTITPVLWTKSGASWVVSGVGTTRTIQATGINTYAFEPVAGTSAVTTSTYWGWYDGSATNTSLGTISFDRATAQYGTALMSGSHYPGVNQAFTTSYDFSGFNDGTSWSGGRIYSVNFEITQYAPPSNPLNITYTAGSSTAPVYGPDQYTGTDRPIATSDRPKQVAYLQGGYRIVQAGQTLTLVVKNATPNQQVWARIWQQAPWSVPAQRYQYIKPRLANTPITLYSPPSGSNLTGGWLVGNTDSQGNFSLNMGAEYFGSFSVLVYVGNMGTNGGGTPPSNPGEPTGPASDGFIMTLPKDNFVNGVPYWSQNSQGVPASPWPAQ